VGYWREWERLYGIGWLVGWDRVIAVCATFINNDMFTHTLSLSLSLGGSRHVMGRTWIGYHAVGGVYTGSMVYQIG